MIPGTCQTCGSTAPIEWFLSDTKYRQVAVVVADLPRPVAKVVFQYMSFFRPTSGRATAVNKALRLLEELRDLVNLGHLQVEHRVSRPAPAHLWAQGIEQMVERRDLLSLPLSNHRYLKKVVYDLADQADAKQEKRHHATTQYKRTRPEPNPEGDVSLDPLEAARRQWDKEHGNAGEVDMSEIGKIDR